MNLHTVQFGTGPDLVFLHGWAMNSVVWKHCLQSWSKTYRITLVDLPGHGQSDDQEPYTLQSLASVISQCVPNPAVWIGWSLGGMVAMVQAIQDASSIRKLVLVCSTPRFVADVDWPCAMQREALREFSKQLHQDYKITLTRFLSLQVRGSDDARKNLRDLRSVLLQSRKPSNLALDQGLEILLTVDLRSCLHKIQCPLLGVYGQYDKLVPSNTGKKILDYLPDAKMITFSGAGHAPFLSHSRQFESAVMEFIDE